MVADLRKRSKTSGEISGINAEIEFTRLKILYVLKNDSQNYRILRMAIYRYVWLLFTRQFACNYLGKEAALAFETVEQFLARVLPVCP